MMFRTRITENVPQIKENIFFRKFPVNSRPFTFIKKRLELRDGAASGARYHKLSDAQYIQRDSLPINLHTRSL